MQDFGNPLSKKMMELISARWTSQALSVIAELRVADFLKDGPLSVEDLAARTQTHADSLFRFLRALASEGIFEQLEDQRFKLTPLGDTLRGDVPGSARPLAMSLGRPWNNDSWQQALHSVRTGEPAIRKALGRGLFEYLSEHPEQYQEFSEAMTGAARIMHTAAIKAYDFSGIGTLVDVGGGHGWLLGSILREYPSMKGHLYDRPHVVAGARGNLEGLGVLERCTLSGGDFFVSVPQGADAYIISNVIHNWGDTHALQLLKNCRAASRAGGRLIILDGVIRPGNEPDYGKRLDLQMLVCTEGRERTAQEYERLCREAGFSLQRVIPTPSSVSIVEAVAV